MAGLALSPAAPEAARESGASLLAVALIAGGALAIARPRAGPAVVGWLGLVGLAAAAGGLDG